MLTAEFTQAVDALFLDTSLSNKHLKARALRYLNLIPNDQLSGPPWARRIQQAIPKATVFSTLYFFAALYHVAAELKLDAGTRYVSATICACHEHVIFAATAGPDHENQSMANLIQALDEVASIWAAFVLWPFYAHGTDIDLNPPSETETYWVHPKPRTEEERLEDPQRWLWKEQVMARDNYYCFMCGRYDTHWFFRQQSKPEGADFNDCGFVRIIKREMFAQDEDSMSARGESLDVDSLGIMRGILERYLGVDEATLAKAKGPQNMLFVNTSACTGFRQFTWCLHPTKTPNRYKIKTYGPQNYAGVRHVTSHVTFVDHSQPPAPPPPSTTTTTTTTTTTIPSSTSQPQTPAPAPAPAGVAEPVPLPSPELLQLHAALSGVLCLSGADTTFECLFARPHWLPGYSCWPAARGAAFWASVVEYAGAETCVEVDLQLSVEELCEDVLERERALAAGKGELEEESESGRRWRRRRTRNSRAGSPRHG